MALQIREEAAVTAFLQSVLQDLAAVIGMVKGEGFLDFYLELKKMENMLSSFQDLLVDGERRRLAEKSVDKWMDDLKDLLYDSDDLLDEIKLERQHLDLTTKSQPSNIQVHNNFPNIYGRSKIIESRICCVLDRLVELTQKADSLKLSRDIVGLYANWTMPPAMSRSETGSAIDDSEIHGREKDIESLVDMLLATDARSTSKKKYDVICLVGMGGLGKTTLAQLVFQDQRVENAFEVKSWACVSDVFYVTKVTKELVESAAPGMGSNIQSLAALQASLKSIVNNKRFLFVLDDVWTTREWDKLKAPFNFGAKGSKILVTTRMKKVADGISNKAPYPLGQLDYEHCWAIFRDKAFEGIDMGINQEEMRKMGKAIVKKCGGVPLAIKVIGAMLRGAEEGRWKAILQNELWHSAFENDEIHPALRLSYYYLPAFLKRCFEYFAIFPSDFKFEQDELVRMWIVEGLIELKGGTLPENIGNQYYNDLKGRSLIQENDRMHDIIHHLACIASGKFFYQAKSGSSSSKAHASVRHASFSGPFHDGKKFELIVDANNLRTLIRTDRFGDGPHEKIWSYKMLRVLDCPSVRSLSKLPSSIGDMKHLRYINLRGCGLAGDIPDSICTLSNLQVLDLKFCTHLQNLPKDMGNLFNLWYLDLSLTGVSSLPESIYTLYNLRALDLSFCHRLTHLAIDIGNLQNLQILKLRDSSISSVPESILNVTSLHVLEIDVGCELPPHIGKLTGLEVLTSYTVGKEKGRGINELKDLNRLKGRLCIDRMENIGTSEEAAMADLKSKKHIVELEFCWIHGSKVEINDAPSNSLARDGESMEGKILEALEPHDALKALAFLNYGGHKLPNWMSNGCIRNLVRFQIAGLGMMERMVGVELPSLKRLTIKNCPVLREVSMATPKLTRLTLEECIALKAASLVLLPSFSDDIAVVHFLAHHLEILHCEYYYLDWFLQQVQASATSTSIKLWAIRVDLGQLDDKVTCLPSGLTSLESLRLDNLCPANFLLLPPNCDDKASSPPALRELCFSNCPNLTCMPSDLHKFTSLRRIDIDQCPELISLDPQDLPADHLEHLWIICCENLRNFPDGFSNFTSLKTLQFYNCPNLEIRPHDVLPPNLLGLGVTNCPKLEEQLEREGRTDWQSLRCLCCNRACRLLANCHDSRVARMQVPFAYVGKKAYQVGRMMSPCTNVSLIL